MCEYLRLNPDNDKAPPMCAVNNQLCTLCVLGNGYTYKKAKGVDRLMYYARQAMGKGR